jgi:hypothetical protein
MWRKGRYSLPVRRVCRPSPDFDEWLLHAAKTLDTRHRFPPNTGLPCPYHFPRMQRAWLRFFNLFGLFSHSLNACCLTVPVLCRLKWADITELASGSPIALSKIDIYLYVLMAVYTRRCRQGVVACDVGPDPYNDRTVIERLTRFSQVLNLRNEKERGTPAGEKLHTRDVSTVNRNASRCANTVVCTSASTYFLPSILVTLYR